MNNRKMMESKLPLEFKHSKELLKLIVMEKGLAKQKRFKEATQIQQRVGKMEALERQKYFEQRQEKIMLSEKNLLDKQKIEMQALQIKLNGKLGDDLKRKDIDQ